MQTVQLQGIGKKPGKAARDIKPGDVLIWNYGFKSLVIDVSSSASGKTITATLKEDSGKIVNRIMRANRLVAFQA